MLVRLCFEADSLQRLTQRGRHACDNIGLAAFFGNLIPVAPRPLLAALSDWAELSERARAAYRVILGRAAENDALLSRVPARLDARLDLDEPRRAGDVWEVPLSLFGSDRILQPPVLLSENVQDAKLYCELGRLFAWHSRCRGSIAFVCAAEGGGGNQTASELVERSRRHMVFCVVDSDRAHPTGALGATARGCRTALPSDEWFARLYVLAEREIENLLPTSWIGRTQTLVQEPAIRDALQLLDRTRDRNLRRFGDLKDGFTLCELLRLGDSTLGLVLAEMAELKAHVPAVRDCLADDDRACERPCFKLAPLGSTIVGQVLTWLSECSPRDCGDVTMPGSIQELASLVFCWGAAMPPVRV